MQTTVNVADKETLDAINTKIDNLGTNVGNVPTKSDLAAAVSPLATATGVASAVAPLATATQLGNAVAPLATQNSLDEVAKDVDDILDHVRQKYKRYGVRIDRFNSDPSARIEYIYDAVGMTPGHMNYTSGAFDLGSWGDVFFVKENYPVMLKSDGTEDYRLSKTDHTKKLDGITDSDVANINYDGNAMSAIPLAYVKMWHDENYEYIVVSDGPYDEDYVAIAHTAQDGTIKPYIYLSMYRGGINPAEDPAQGAASGADANSKLRSIKGLFPHQSWTAQQEIDGARRNNPAGTHASDTNGWYTRTWGQRQLINAELLLIGKSDDSQTIYGKGATNCYNASLPTYGMVEAGRDTNDKGQFWGANDETHQVKVFYIVNTHLL